MRQSRFDVKTAKESENKKKRVAIGGGRHEGTTNTDMIAQQIEAAVRDSATFRDAELLCIRVYTVGTYTGRNLDATSTSTST